MCYRVGIAETREFESQEYVDDRGRSPFRRWFDSLDAKPAAKIAAAVARMEGGNLGDHRHVGDGVWECRIHSGPGYRIYAGFDEDTLIILLGGGTKRSQRGDIDKARKRWHDYKRRRP